MLSLEGKQLGNYDVIRPIRVGGMGAVYEGRQRTAFGRRVAIKVIHNDYAGDRDMRRRFAREARTIARLQHPYILPLIEFGDEQGILYLVMPLIEGGTLTSYLRRNLPDLTEVASIYQQLLDAVEYAHDEGLIHRDIKSSNVLLEMRRNGPPHVYLADFGLVRVIRPNDAFQVGKPIPLEQVPGTPHYMAPEQTRGIVTPLTDIYALGVMLYQLLTGFLPYNDPDEVRVIQMHLNSPIPSPCDEDASIPYELGEVVKTAMAKHPDDRYQSVGELRRAFLAALKGPVAYGMETQSRGKKQGRPGSTFLTYRQHTKDLQPDNISASLSLQQHTTPTVPPVPEPILLQRKSSTQERPRQTRELSEQAQTLSLQQLPEDVLAQEIAHKMERVNRLRTTEAIPGNRNGNDLNRIRNTEDPVAQGQPNSANVAPALPAKPLQTRKARQRHPFRLSLIIALLLVVILLVASHTLNMNIIPAVGGTQATIQITAKAMPLQESYVLTAAPQYTSPDPQKFAIPARVLQSTSTDGNTASTTGLKTVGGSSAQGRLLFTNTSKNAVTVPAGQEFITTADIHIKLTTTVDITVPGQDKNGAQGMAFEPAIVVTPGAAGNVPSHSLQTTFAPGVTVQNIDPFTGGIDGQVIHTVAQADIDGLLTNLRKKLTQQATQQLQNQLAPGEVMAGKVNYSETVKSSAPVDAQAVQVQVTLTVQASIPAYKPSLAVQVASTLLTNQANHNLVANFKRANTITEVGNPGISVVKNNTIILSVTVHGIWIYSVTATQINQWRQSLLGLTPTLAQSYLKTQAGVGDAHIQLPLGTDHLPSNSSDIIINFQS